MSTNRDLYYARIVELGYAIWVKYRASCTNMVAEARKRNELPAPDTLVCVDCGKPAQAYDHRDYTKPLDVQPVCDGCNVRRGPAALPYRIVYAHIGGTFPEAPPQAPNPDCRCGHPAGRHRKWRTGSRGRCKTCECDRFIEA